MYLRPVEDKLFTELQNPVYVNFQIQTIGFDLGIGIILEIEVLHAVMLLHLQETWLTTVKILLYWAAIAATAVYW